MSKSLRKLLNQVVLMALFFSLGGCAARKLVVRNADTLLEYQVQKRLPLYSEQKKELSKEITAFLNEKRPLAQEVLPVIDELNIAENDKIEGQYRRLAAIYDRISLDFTQLLSRQMVKLDSKQQKEFFEVLDEENRELEEKEADDALKKTRERFKTFFGSVTDDQKQLLTEEKAQLAANVQAKLERRRELHQRFREIFKGGGSREAKQEEIQEAFKDFQAKAHHHEKNIAFLKKLLPTVSKEQREFFRRRVAEVKEMLKLFLETDY